MEVEGTLLKGKGGGKGCGPTKERRGRMVTKFARQDYSTTQFPQKCRKKKKFKEMVGMQMGDKDTD